MSEPTFTPGPWRVHVEEDRYLSSPIYSFFICTNAAWPDSQVARVNIQDGMGEREANARLIAAAPSMFAALERIARMTDIEADFDGFEARQIARDVIAGVAGEAA